MAEFRVRWGIELDAENEREAAEKALAWLRDPERQVGAFMVTNNEEPDAQPVEVDLTPDEEDEEPGGRAFNNHSNDIGDWCPWSTCTVTENYSDERCPAGCTASRVVESGE